MRYEHWTAKQSAKIKNKSQQKTAQKIYNFWVTNI